MNTSPIRAVFFDAVGTLIHPEPAAAAAYHLVGQRHGSQLDLVTVKARFKAAFRRQEEQDLANGLRTDEGRELARWRAIVAEVLDDVPEGEACFRELYEHFARPASWRCQPELGPVLRELVARGYRVGVASNFDARLRGLLTALADFEPVEHLVISAEVGWRKPAPRFFEAMCRVVQMGPEEVLLVGDDPDNDYAGARAAGLPAVLLGERIRELPELLALLPSLS